MLKGNMVIEINYDLNLFQNYNKMKIVYLLFLFMNLLVSNHLYSNLRIQDSTRNKILTDKIPHTPVSEERTFTFNFQNSQAKENHLLSIIIPSAIALIAAFLAFRQIKLNHIAAAQLQWFRTIREVTSEYSMNADSSHASLIQYYIEKQKLKNKKGNISEKNKWFLEYTKYNDRATQLYFELRLLWHKDVQQSGSASEGETVDDLLKILERIKDERQPKEDYFIKRLKEGISGEKMLTELHDLISEYIEITKKITGMEWDRITKDSWWGINI